MTGLSALWPLAVSVGIAFFVLSFVLPEPAVVTMLRILSVVALVLAAVFAIPGIG